jgi:predicted HAD superfamily Cof-like phosphohydrolase
MQQQLKDLETFQKAFNSTYNETPTLLSEEDWKLRYKLSLEELEEYKEACEQGDIVEIFDAILDRLFLAFGDAISHGLQDKLIDGFNEVVRSNMSKLDDNGKPFINGENGVWDETRPKGKILKSQNFFEPNLKQFL